MIRIDTAHILELIEEYQALAAQRQPQPVTADAITGWHRQIGHLDYDVTREAVGIYHKANQEPIQPGHIIEIAADVERRPKTTPRMRRAVMTAYQLGGALNYDCDECQAPAGEPCTNPVTQQHAHIPCLTRITGKTRAA
ncbi:hypothetical protein [Nocardia brasiliensis]|uniref:hypothetical protein n=1 Tax=Nocardia brasiliensis TaxID=37326 RepID=UPI0024561F51|nr:hypothetical protein [Nocardia brasiliensis]